MGQLRYDRIYIRLFLNLRLLSCCYNAYLRKMPVQIDILIGRGSPIKAVGIKEYSAKLGESSV